MIYCNGDSFTQGTELVDHIYFKDVHPGFIQNKYLTNPEVVKEYREKFSTTIMSKKLSDEDLAAIPLETPKRAWPAKLDKLVDVPVINAGEAGSSMDSICRRTVMDITNLLNEGKKIDLAIIQITFKERFEVNYKNQSFSIFPAYLQVYKDNPMVFEQGKLKIVCETEYTYYRNWLLNITHMINFFKANMIDYMFMQSMPYGNPIGKYKTLINLEKNVNFDFSMYECCQTFPDDAYTLCPGGHYTELVHEKIAEELAKIYEAKR